MFSLRDAESSGLSRSALRGRNWQRVAWGLYRGREMQDDPASVLRGWMSRLPAGTIFAGATAAWLHGLKLDPLNPIEVIVGLDRGVRTRVGLIARRRAVADNELVTAGGLPATTMLRTLADLCCWRSPVEALVALDMAIAARVLNRIAITEYATAIRGRAGSVRLRELIRVAAPAESPMETRLRWLFIKSGLPMPDVQVDLYSDAGILIARADMYYPVARLIIEFDGVNHKRRLVSDDRRQNLLVNAGYRLLRFTTPDLIDRPALIVMQVRAALATSTDRAF